MKIKFWEESYYFKESILTQQWVTYSKKVYSFLLANHTSLLFHYSTLEKYFRKVERFWIHFHTVDNVASYHGLSGHEPHSQGFFPNRAIDQLTSINRSALGKKHWERGWVGMHYCWVFKLNKNSFHTVGSRESSS